MNQSIKLKIKIDDELKTRFWLITNKYSTIKELRETISSHYKEIRKCDINVLYMFYDSYILIEKYLIADLLKECDLVECIINKESQNNIDKCKIVDIENKISSPICDGIDAVKECVKTEYDSNKIIETQRIDKAEESKIDIVKVCKGNLQENTKQLKDIAENEPKDNKQNIIQNGGKEKNPLIKDNITKAFEQKNKIAELKEKCKDGINEKIDIRKEDMPVINNINPTSKQSIIKASAIQEESFKTIIKENTSNTTKNENKKKKKRKSNDISAPIKSIINSVLNHSNKKTQPVKNKIKEYENVFYNP
ncbi:hypothetical protein TCON_0052 [Astathelohania contejeani]|uniref:Ubiquitin-like domain-containing protein n=1 Tax=Astathelohania contejeani TaxID=164912 RepID=A0ABQ7I2L6_9MICR|nr:hypothetical protein TCON_0052 [Thelohania contejeani]